MHTFVILQEEDKGKRFEYLLQQTEIFSHFMNATGGNKRTPTSPLKVTPPSFKKRERKRHPSASA